VAGFGVVIQASCLRFNAGQHARTTTKACTAAAAVVGLQARSLPGLFEATAGRAISSAFRASGRTESRRIAMSRFLARLALAAAIGVCLVGAAAAIENETSVRPLPSAGQSKILAALDQPTDFDFQERSLSDVVSYCTQKHEIEILLDSEALSEAGVGTDAPVTLSLKNIRLRSALRLLLAQRELTYVVGDGYLLITSKAEAESKLNFKIYPVHDLVTLDSAFRPIRSASGDEDGFLNAAGGTVPLPRPPGDAGDFLSLIDTIMSTVSSTTWDQVGGPGTITENANLQAIAVSQTDDVHEEIVALLAALRRVRDEQIAAAKPLDPTASPDTPQQERPLSVRGYRFMRGPKSPGKSGWRPPQEFVGDSAPPRDTRANVKKQEVAEPSGVEGATAKDSAPSTDSAPTKDMPPAKDPAPTNDAAPAKEAEPAAGAADKQPPAKPTDAKLEAWVEIIAKVVPEMIEPESWAPSGDGTIRAVGEGIVVRNTEEIQRRVARLMAELLPDYVPVDFRGLWGPWQAALEANHATVRLRPSTIANWPHQAEPRPSGVEALIHEALLETCELEFNELPLIDALNRLAEQLHAQLFIDRHALADESIRTDTPMTCLVKGLSNRAALKLLLDELKLDYSIRDEVLLVTTKVEAEDMLTVRVYPVFDLVVRPLNASTNRPSLGFQSLIDNIVAIIAPTTWDEVGGPGSIQPFTNSGALVIAQTTTVHEEIAAYLKALREVAAQNASQ
jgi:hypothetical protein